LRAGSSNGVVQLASTMIPKKIHYCWFGGTALRPLHLRCRDSWLKFHPEWEFVFWDERNAPLHIPVIAQALKDRRWNHVSDWTRLWALQEQGGVYLDTDVELVHALDPVLDDACFLGFQTPQPTPWWINCAVFGGVAGHPFFGRLWERMLAENPPGIYKTVQPEVATLLLREAGLSSYGDQTIDAVRIHPHEVFYPYSWLQSPHAKYIKPETIAVHHWEGTWIAPKDRIKFRVKRWLQRFGLRESKV